MRLIFKILLFSSITTMFFSCNQNKTNKHFMENNGLVVKQSKFDFNTTYAKLHDVLESNPNLKIILELDHSKNAASKDLQLRPTKIILFGNPMLGTPLMQNSATVALDLPQKIVVFEADNMVQVAYNDPLYLKNRHGIENSDEVLTKIAGALNKITDVAVGN